MFPIMNQALKNILNYKPKLRIKRLQIFIIQKDLFLWKRLILKILGLLNLEHKKV